MKKLIAVLAVILVTSTASGQVDPTASAANQLYEQKPLYQVVPFKEYAGYGESRVIQHGSEVLMYTTGIEDFRIQPLHDKIWLWTNLNTWAGWSGTAYTRAAAPILPQTNCSSIGSTPNACRTLWNYGNPWAWKNPTETNDSKVYFFASTGDQQHWWPEVLLGESTDGKNFKFKGLIRTTNAVDIVKVTWQPIKTNDGIWRFWGYVDFKYHDGRPDRGMGAIRFTPSFGAPHLIDANAKMEIWTGGRYGSWRQVPRCASGDQYTFCMDFEPHLEWAGNNGGNNFPHLYKMTRYGGSLELWVSAQEANPPVYNCNCTRTHNWQNAFVYFPVTTPTSVNDNPWDLIGQRKVLLQQLTNKLRCNPGGYNFSRQRPIRLEWTYNLFYSRAFEHPDHNKIDCPPEDSLGGPWGYIIVTQLTTNPNGSP